MNETFEKFQPTRVTLMVQRNCVWWTQTNKAK